MQPLQKATSFKPLSHELIKVTMEQYGLDEAGAIQWIDEDQANVEVWINETYQVEVRRNPTGWTQLNIRRRDGNVIFRDWREFQDIKNQLVGPEVEAIELYPAESRLVDTSNKYHLWCLPPGQRIPVGWEHKDVKDDEGHKKGLRQRPLPKSWKEKV